MALNRHFRRLASILTVTAIALSGLPCRAQNLKEAAGLFEAGNALARAGNCEDAVVKFEASIAIEPVKNALYNLGICYQKIDRPLDAARVFERLRQTFADALKDLPEGEEGLDRHMTEINALVGRLQINVQPDGAAVAIDGQKVGLSPLLEPRILLPGPHRIQLSLDGYAPFESEVTVRPGAQPVDFHAVMSKLVPLEGATSDARDESLSTTEGPPSPSDATATNDNKPSIETPPAAETKTEKRSKGLLIGGILTAAGGVAGIAVGGVYTQKGNTDRDALKAASTGSKETYDTLYNDTLPADQTATIVGYTVGGVLLAAGVVMIVVDRLKSHSGEKAPSPTSALSAAPTGVGIAF